jgi:peptidoglycan biosynthesis protein MviN/MurJ (putative lipid II flippase)
MYVSTLFRQEPFLFIGTKLFTGILLFAVLQLYNHDTFDHRLLAMAASVAGVGNFMVMAQLKEFDLKYFPLMKNLPITLAQRWLTIALVTCVVSIPEGAIVAKYFPSLPVQNFLSITFLIPAIAILIYAMQFIRYSSEESFARWTFGITILHIVLILFKIPIEVCIIVNLTISWIVFRKKYYTYETMPVIEK